MNKNLLTILALVVLAPTSCLGGEDMVLAVTKQDPSVAEEPTKENAVRLLNDILTWLENEEYQTARLCFSGLSEGGSDDEIQRELAQFIDRREISRAGIAALAKTGTWGPLDEVFPKRGSAMVKRFGLPSEECFGLIAEPAEVAMHWNGDRFSIIRLDDVGKLEASPKPAVGDDSTSNKRDTTAEQGPAWASEVRPDSELYIRGAMWRLGRNVTLYAFASAKGLTNEAKQLLTECKSLCEVLKTEMPPLRDENGQLVAEGEDLVTRMAQAMNFVLVVAVRELGPKIELECSSAARNAFDLGLISSMAPIAHFGDPEDGSTQALIQRIERSGNASGIPKFLWMPLLNKMRSGATSFVVTEEVQRSQREAIAYFEAVFAALSNK